MKHIKEFNEFLNESSIPELSNELDLNIVADYLQSNMKSIKRFRSWVGNETREMKITLPYTYKSQIGRRQESETQVWIDFDKKDVRYTNSGGGPSGRIIGTFNTTKKLLGMLKKTLREDKKKSVAADNDSWAY